MEILIAILAYLGIILPGTYNTSQINMMLMQNQQQISSVQGDATTLQAASQTNTTEIIIIDMDKIH